MSNGVHSVLYPVYSNAFSSDILLRVGPSVDAVLQDLDYIIGKLGGLSEQELNNLLQPPKSTDELGIKDEKQLMCPQKKTRINYWNYINPFWLLYRLIVFAWNHKIIATIISTVIAGLILSYLKGWLGIK